MFRSRHRKSRATLFVFVTVFLSACATTPAFFQGGGDIVYGCLTADGQLVEDITVNPDELPCSSEDSNRTIVELDVSKPFPADPASSLTCSRQARTSVLPTSTAYLALYKLADYCGDKATVRWLKRALREGIS